MPTGGCLEKGPEPRRKLVLCEILDFQCVRTHFICNNQQEESPLHPITLLYEKSVFPFMSTSTSVQAAFWACIHLNKVYTKDIAKTSNHVRSDKHLLKLS